MFIDLSEIEIEIRIYWNIKNFSFVNEAKLFNFWEFDKLVKSEYLKMNINLVVFFFPSPCDVEHIENTIIIFVWYWIIVSKIDCHNKPQK